jgi:hypothetical protein
VQKKTRGERRTWGAGSTREKTSGEERRNARNSVWQFSTGNSKTFWRAPVRHERENEVVSPL